MRPWRNTGPPRYQVGTLVGRSAVRMGRHLKTGQRIACVELREDMAGTARFNIQRAGLSDSVEVVAGDAVRVLPTLRGSLDVVFLTPSRKTTSIT